MKFKIDEPNYTIEFSKIKEEKQAWFLCYILELDMSDLLIKIILFLLFGGIGFAVDLFIATQLIKRNTMKLVYANSIGFIVGICIKFFLVNYF